MNPIVIVGCGFRCGSTLLQRILCAAPRTMIWGESNDALPRVLEAHLRLGFWQSMSRAQEGGLRRKGSSAWIANLQPPLDQVQAATRAWIEAMYRRGLDGEPVERWGLKELRLGPSHVSTLWSAFPDARVVFVLRHPRPLLASMVGTGWFGDTSPDAAATRWIERVEWALRTTDSRFLLVRYEALSAEPRATLDAVADHLGLARADLDASITDVVVRGTDRAPVVDTQVEAALARPDLRALAARVGYDLA